MPPWAISACMPSGLALMNSVAWAISAAGFERLVAGILIGIAQVALDRAREQDALLRDVADLVAQVVLGDLADIDAVHQDRAIGDIVEARDQVDDGGFARAGGADEGGGLAGLGGKADIVQHILFSARVAEDDIAELDACP